MKLKEQQLTNQLKRQMRSNHLMGLLAKEDSKTDSRISNKSLILALTTTLKVTSNNKVLNKLIKIQQHLRVLLYQMDLVML